jgi:hypothetical protein
MGRGVGEGYEVKAGGTYGTSMEKKSVKLYGQIYLATERAPKSKN